MENYEEEMENLLSEKMGEESCNTMKSVDIHISVPMLEVLFFYILCYYMCVWRQLTDDEK